MKERRAFSGATYDTAHGLVLTGGNDGNALLDTAEHTFDGVTFDSFAAIPIESFSIASLPLTMEGICSKPEE